MGYGDGVPSVGGRSGRQLLYREQDCPQGKKERKEFVTPTEMNVHGDALCFMVKTHKTTEKVLNDGWRLEAVGGWRLVAFGGWRLEVSGW